MDIRNAKHNADGLTINCEIDHPEIGWIPYTASPEVETETGKTVWAALQNMEVAPFDEEAHLAQAKASALAALNADYEAAANPLIRDYPATERLSWAQQLSEAEAYQAWVDAGEQGDAPATPTLSAILSGRNGSDGTETLADLAAAVINRAAAFIQWQQYTGLRQRGEWAIQAAETPDEARAVTWQTLTQDTQ